MVPHQVSSPSSMKESCCSRFTILSILCRVEDMKGGKVLMQLIFNAYVLSRGPDSRNATLSSKDKFKL